jgi:transcriptional regulator with XRE-family HTH domain
MSPTATPAYQSDRHTELKVYLLRHGLSQHRLARDLGLSVQHLNRILMGTRHSPRVVAKLITLFDIPASLLPSQAGQSKAA